jgi:NitT/TauT family transport system ATP-binding protein
VDLNSTIPKDGSTAVEGHIQVSGLQFEYNGLPVIRSIDLSIKDHEVVCIVGPSGSGKTTLLRLIAGFLTPTAGSISISGDLVRGPSSAVGIIFQQSTLFPWLTIRKNVEFGLRSRLVRNERRTAGDQLISLVGLSDFAESLPKQLSGGMSQRAALARALAGDPRVLLMDEPFASLDAVAKIEMHDVLVNVWARKKMAVVFVTHDIDESVSIADRILILSHRPSTIVSEFEIDLPRPRVVAGVRCEGFELIRNQVASKARDLFTGTRPVNPPVS